MKPLFDKIPICKVEPNGLPTNEPFIWPAKNVPPELEERRKAEEEEAWKLHRTSPYTRRFEGEF